MKTKSKISICLSLLLCCLIVVVAYRQTSQAQTKPKGISSKEVYTGTILYYPDIRSPRTSTTTRTFTLIIESETPTADIARLPDLLKEQGQDGLLKAISKTKRGSIQIGGNVGRDLGGVMVTEGEEGGRKITALGERWIQFGEARAGTRSLDYPFTYLELIVDEKGKGEGMMIPAAKIRFKNNTVEVENFATYPARLMGVQRRN